MTPHLISLHVMQALLHDIQQTQLPRMELSLLLQRLLLVAMTSSDLQDPVLAYHGCRCRLKLLQHMLRGVRQLPLFSAWQAAVRSAKQLVETALIA